jgi:hypothetical protein
MKSLFAAAAIFALTATATAGEPPKQTHHCKMPDGSMDMAKTKKECKAAKGTWAKDAAAAGDETKAKGDDTKAAKPEPDTKTK